MFYPLTTPRHRSRVKDKLLTPCAVALSGTVFIDRTNRRTAVAAFDGAAAEMQKYRQSVFIFAEGTRSYFDKPDLLPFRKGAFHLAIQAKVPIVPVVVANYSYVLNVSKLIFRSGTIPVKGAISVFVLLLLLVADEPSG